ncbi:hypothetical protein ACSBR2_036981 [Camellia fascicularis]
MRLFLLYSKKLLLQFSDMLHSLVVCIVFAFGCCCWKMIRGGFQNRVCSASASAVGELSLLVAAAADFCCCRVVEGVLVLCPLDPQRHFKIHI